MESNKVINLFLLLGFATLIFVLAFFVLKPILIPIVVGLLFAYVFAPVYNKINKKIKRPNISALILIIAIIVLVAIPTVYFTPMIVRQTFGIYTTLQEINLGDLLGTVIPSLFGEEISQAISLQISNILSKFFSSFLNEFTDLLVNLPNLIIQFVVFGFTFYFAIRDGNKLTDYIYELSPFTKHTEKKFANEFRGITNAIMYGQVLIGIIQGLALGVGLYFLGLENVVMLTFLTVLVSIIPVLGSWLVWFPIGIMFLIQGDIFSGIFLLCYGLVFVSLIDNFLRPYLLSKSSHLPLSISLLGTFGGLYMFGIIGLVLGPLILAYALILIEFHKEGKLKELGR